MENKEIKPSDFNLSKVKLSKDGGIEAEYQVSQVVNDEASVVERKESCSREVHPDLKERFAELRSIVARVFGMTSFLSFIDAETLSHNVADRARAFADELLQKIDVRGVSWSGSDDNTGVVITSVYETGNGQKTAINTPRLRMATISFGFEEELEAITEAIKAEVYEYLFNGKQAQMSLFGEGGDKDADPDVFGPEGTV